MISTFTFQVQHHEFNENLTNQIKKNQYVEGLWPLVYILSDQKTKEAYVGETTDAISRMSSHLKSDSKKKLSVVHLITSEMFNKSATLDIESNLIKYLSGDGQFKLINGNIGIANHTYYQKNEMYWMLFKTLWKKLQTEGIAKHEIEWIDNSDLFKYSPYKSLGKEQIKGMVHILESLLSQSKGNVVVDGGAGTGKSIMAIFLFKLLVTPLEDLQFKEFGVHEKELYDLAIALKKRLPHPKIALVIPMKSFRKTLQNVFKNIKGLRSNMVVGPTDIVGDKYDLIVVDESHRLRQRKNLGTYFGSFDKINKQLGFEKSKGSELDWIQKQAKLKVFFYDSKQTIKPADVDSTAFSKILGDTNTILVPLHSQFRVKAGIGYVEHLEKIFESSLSKVHLIPTFNDYEFYLFDSIRQMKEELNKREQKFGLSRMIAGYSWPWKSNKDAKQYDIEIEGLKLRWNSTAEDWVNSDTAPIEVGCIHTTQGYDLNYGAIIFGNEITYDFNSKSIVIRPENYYDKNGKNSINDPAELKKYIINIYKTIMLRGIRGTFVYACDENLRRYLRGYIQTFGSYESDVKLTIAAEN